MSSPNPDDRTAFIDGLLSLACFFEAHPDLPVPSGYHGSTILVFADGETDGERCAAVDQAAAVLGTVAGEERPGSGHYAAQRKFGPAVAYRVLNISDVAQRRHEARQSYADSVRVDDGPVAA